MPSIGIIVVLRDGRVTPSLDKLITDRGGSIIRDGGFFLELTLDSSYLDELNQHPDVLRAGDGNAPFRDAFPQ